MKVKYGLEGAQRRKDCWGWVAVGCATLYRYDHANPYWAESVWRDPLLNILSNRAASLSDGCQVVTRKQTGAGTIIVQSELGKKESKGGTDDILGM